MILPAFGVISEVLPVFSRKPIFGYKAIAFSSVAIGFLSLLVWAHHMFTVGMPIWLQAFFMIASMVIAVPTGIKIFNWVATTWRGNLQFDTAMLFALGFIVVFTIGGLSGIFVAAFPFDWQAHDTYFVVAHFHYVLFGGAMFALFAALFYWWPKIFGRMLDERLGKWTFWLVFIGFNVTFQPQHLLGLLGMHRRVYTYPDEPTLEHVQPDLVDRLVRHGRSASSSSSPTSRSRGGAAGGPATTRGSANTLEWYTTSPPPAHNFDARAVRDERAAAARPPRSRLAGAAVPERRRPGPLAAADRARRGGRDRARRSRAASSGSRTACSRSSRCRRSSRSSSPRGPRTGALRVPGDGRARALPRRARDAGGRGRCTSRSPRSRSRAALVAVAGTFRGERVAARAVARLRDADEAADHVAAAPHRRGRDVRRRRRRAAARRPRRPARRARARVRRRERAQPRARPRHRPADGQAHASGGRSRPGRVPAAHALEFGLALSAALVRPAREPRERR